MLARLFNSYISSLIDGDPNFSQEDIYLVGLMNFGTQINGSDISIINPQGILEAAIEVKAELIQLELLNVMVPPRNPLIEYFTKIKLLSQSTLQVVLLRLLRKL